MTTLIKIRDVFTIFHRCQSRTLWSVKQVACSVYVCLGCQKPSFLHGRTGELDTFSHHEHTLIFFLGGGGVIIKCAVVPVWSTEARCDREQ